MSTTIRCGFKSDFEQRCSNLTGFFRRSICAAAPVGKPKFLSLYQYALPVCLISNKRDLVSTLQPASTTGTSSRISKIPDAKEGRERAYNTALSAAELRLLAEARLGELIKQEQEAGRLATEGQPKKGSTSGTFLLKDYGLTKQDSHRARKVYEHRDLIPTVIDRAIEQNDIPTRKDILRAAIANRVGTRDFPPLPEGKFNVIYTDLPWEYAFSATVSCSIEAHYPTLALADICR
ncbi:hypothetical protein M1N88_02140 [Dehalococcoidia bacterium]|nr:hypothetical protein [Dehalococcoidia bacterium]